MTGLQQFQTIDLKSADVSRMERLSAAYSQAEKREYAQPDSDLLRTNHRSENPLGADPAPAPHLFSTRQRCVFAALQPTKRKRIGLEA